MRNIKLKESITEIKGSTYIDEGKEGFVYSYKGKYAIKTMWQNYAQNIESKESQEKIKALSKLHHKNFAFPIGLVKNNYNVVIAYYMKLIETDPNYPNINSLFEMDNEEEIANIIIQMDKAIQWAHKKGIFIGDYKKENILIDKKFKPIFVDTNNFSYKQFSLNLYPKDISILDELYKKKFSHNDIDIYLFIRMFLSYSYKLFKSDYNIEKLNVSSDIREYLNIIFSDSINKPYLTTSLNNNQIKKLILSIKQT